MEIKRSGNTCGRLATRRGVALQRTSTGMLRAFPACGMMTTPTAAQIGSRWQPIVKDSHHQRVKTVIGAIAEALATLEADSLDASLAGGSAGVALFFSYLQAASLDPRWSDCDSAWLTRALHAEPHGQRTPSLFSGSAGVAWTVEHIGYDSLDARTIKRDVDLLLLGLTELQPWTREYDLVSGLVGYGLYALDRLNDRVGAEILAHVILRLEECSQRTDHGNAWWTAPELLPGWQREISPNGYYNLGLAHGVPGVIAILAQACAAGISVSRARPLLEGAVEWILSQRSNSPYGFRFSSWTPTHQPCEGGVRSRVAWCYGDLGVAAALHWAGTAVGELAWERAALEIAGRLTICPMELAGAKDACLCHGAAGNAHVFNRFYQATGDQAFLNAAHAWIDRTLDFFRPESGVGGFQVWAGGRGDSGSVEWLDAPGVLEGSAGIGLMLLSAMSGVEPRWDRMLLVSLPPRER
jgi:lantibiotic biosynthesis protein